MLSIHTYATYMPISSNADMPIQSSQNQLRNRGSVCNYFFHVQQGTRRPDDCHGNNDVRIFLLHVPEYLCY